MSKHIARELFTLRAARRIAWATVASVPIFAYGYIFYYRSDPASEDLKNVQSSISRKLKSDICLSEHADSKDSPLLTAAQFMTIGSVSILSRIFLYGLNDFNVKHDANYQRLIRSVKYRPAGKPLLTVSNHNCTLDDPTLFGTFVPLSVALTPSQMRWTICSEELCFMNAFTSTFFGSGKVMPIQRGGGIDQLHLHKFARRLAAGSWCHVFPEGRTVQTGHVGGRIGKNESQIGSLKWGVGKLIAHAPVLPEIIPFYHTGMQNVVPENPYTRDILSPIPSRGHNITFRVGAPIFMDDLIDDFEKKNGKLKKVSPSIDSDSPDYSWNSTPQERELYSSITRRIQVALEDLEAQAKAELRNNYPEKPDVVISGEWEKKILS